MSKGYHGLAPRLNAQLRELLGETWQEKFRTDRANLNISLDLEMISRVEENLKALVPLDTALRAEGWTMAHIAGFMKYKAKQPYRYAAEKWEQAIAIGEASSIKKLSNPDTSQKMCEQQRWLLERVIKGNPYSPTTKQQKTIVEDKTVTVKMSLDRNVIKAQTPQLSLVAPVMEATIVDAVPELKKESTN